MAPLVVENAVRVSLTGSAGARPFTCVIAGLITGGATATELATDIANAWISEIVEVRGLSSYNWTTAQYVDLTSTTGPSGPVPDLVGWPNAGPDTSDPCPPNTAALVRYAVPGGRLTRGGRTYWPGIPEAQVGTTGELNNTWRNQLSACFDSFLDTVLEGEHGEVGVIGKASESTYEVRGISSLEVAGVAATQRRRLRK